MPLDQRLRQARAFAISNNIDIIRKVSAEEATNNAYGNQALKKSQVGLGETRSTGGAKSETLLDRVKSGNVSPDEYRENYAEIQKQMKAEIGL